MKKFYFFMLLALAIIAGGGIAWARLNPSTTNYLTEVKDGDEFFIKGEYQNGTAGDFLAQPRWLGLEVPRTTDDDALIVRSFLFGAEPGDDYVFVAEMAESEIAGHQGFYLKQKTTGKYLSKDEEEGAGLEAAINLTSDKSKASVWAFIPVLETLPDVLTAPDDAMHVVTLSNDGRIVYFNNNFNGRNNTWTPRVAVYTDGTTWCSLCAAEEEQDAEEAAIKDLELVFNQAMLYYGDNGLTGGSEPGYYPEAIAVEFNAAYKAANVDQIIMNPNHTIADLVAARERLEIILAEVVKGPNKVVSDEYYYIVSAYTWNDGNTKAVYMSDIPRWKTLEEENSAYLWKFIELEDGNYGVQNMFSETFVQSLSQSAAAVMGTDTAAVRLVSLGQGQFNIIPATGGSPFHPEGHNEGVGTAGRIVGWGGGLNSQSAWFLRSVPQEIVEKLKEAVIKEQELAQTQKQLIAQIADINVATKAAFEYEIPEGAIDVTPLSYEDFESNAAMLDGAPEAERHGASWGNDGTGYGALIDNNLDTYFHTSWGSALIEWSAYNEDKTPADGATRTSLHNLSMKLAQPVTNVAFQVSARKGNYNNPTKIDMEVSADGINWSTIFYGYDFFTPTTNAEEPYLMGPFDLGGEYQYVRFANYGNDRNKSGRFFTFSELKVFSGARLTATCQASTMDQNVVKNFLEAYSNANKYADVVTVDDLDNIKSALNQLDGAYAAFKGEFADPTALNEAIASASVILNNYRTGTDQVGIYDGSISKDALADAVADAEELLAGLGFTQQAVDDALIRIQTEKNKLEATLVMPDANKWYQLQFANAEEYASLGYGEGEGLIDRVAAVAQNAYAPTEDTPGSVEYYFAGEIREGAHFYSTNPTELPDAELSYFRFIPVGKNEYLIQNKASGLFIPYLPWSSMAYLGTDPGIFKVDILGAGFCTLSSYNLYDGSCYGGDNPNPNTLHFANPAQSYEMRGWPDHKLGSKSAMKIVEVKPEDNDVAPIMRDLNEEEAYATIFNFNVEQIANATAYVPASIYADGAETYVILKEIEQLPAGKPVIVIGGTDVAEFYLGTTVTREALAEDGLAASFTEVTNLTAADDAALVDFDDEEFVPVLNYITKNTTLNARSPYVTIGQLHKASDEDFADAEYIILVQGLTDGVKGVKAEGIMGHDIYNLAGQRVGSTRQLQTIKRGIYVINGKKVLIP